MALSSFEHFAFSFEHIEKLLDRRQNITSFYLSVNAGILAVIGLLLKDAQLATGWLEISVLTLLAAGLIACWIWRSLLQQYDVLIGWWYARLREIEASTSDSLKLIAREYQELYIEIKNRMPHKRLGLTKQELALNWLFVSLYLSFALGILWGVLSSLI